jgi:predicted NBD/HSP70 family sugar kinase
MTSMQRGSNVPRLGDFNQRVVLDCIRRTTTGISRVEIAGLTGLSEQTVSNLTRRLLEEGLVIEVGREVNGPGKPRTMLGLNSQGMFSIGIHLDPVTVAVLMLNLAGEVVQRTTVMLEDDADPASVLDGIVTAVERVTAAHPAALGRMMGVGVGVPGPLDVVRGVMINPPLLQTWRDVPIATLLRSRLALPVCVEKDLIAAAAGEAWLRQGSIAPDFLYVYLGAGLGFGLVHDGAVQHGVSHNFGEVNMFIIQTSEPPLSCCVVPGSFAHRISPRHLIHAAAEGGALDRAEVDSATNSPTGRDALVAVLAQQARDGDAASMRIFEALADDLAAGLAPLTDLLDVNEVVIGGHSWARYADLVSAPMARRLGERAVLRTARPVHVQSSRAMHEAIAIGAATMVLDERVSPDARGLSGRRP